MAIPVATMIKEASAIRIAHGSLLVCVRPDFKLGKVFGAFISRANQLLYSYTVSNNEF